MRKDSILQQYYYKKLPKYQDKGEVLIPNPIPKDEFIKRSKQSIPQAVDFWKNWYAGRQTLPQFKDVSERRLKLLEQPIDVQYLQPTQLMKENTVGRYIPETKKMELVDPLNEYLSKGSRDDIDRFNEFMSIATGIPVVGHELFHRLGYQAPQGNINLLTKYPHGPSFERSSKPIFAPAKEYGIPKEQYQYYSYEEMIPSAKRNKQSSFPSEKATVFHPEMEAGVAMLRMAENMDPVKTYTAEDIKPLVDKYFKYKQDNNLEYDLSPQGYESQHKGWFINRMFQMLGNDPDKIAKYLNSVARTEHKPLDFAKDGGLVKAQYGVPSARELARQNQSYSTDAALAAKMQADAQAARLKSKMLSAAKESYIAPARKSTPQEEQMRMIRNRTYQAQNAPYTRMNAQGDLSRAIPNVSMTGQPDVKTPEARWQKGAEHMMNAMEAAGAIQGLGYLGREGYNAARAALAESMESGLLSNTYKINPWRFKPNPEAYYHRSPNIENIVNRETGMLQGFGESEAGKLFTQNALVKQSGINLQKGANSRLYFSKGTPLDYGRTNMILDEKTGKLIPGQGYPGPYIVEVEGVPMGASTKGRVPGVEPTRIGSYAVSRRPIFANEAKYYKEDWLRGYKEVPKPISDISITRGPIPNPYPGTTISGRISPNVVGQDVPEELRPFIMDELNKEQYKKFMQSERYNKWLRGDNPGGTSGFSNNTSFNFGQPSSRGLRQTVRANPSVSTSISAPGQRMDVTFGRPGDDVTNTSIEDLVDLYRVQEKGFDINSNTIAQMEKAAAEGKLSPVQKMMLNNPYDRKRLMARDKYWGQWFEKDPKRLDYYIKDKGPESEILHVRIPRSEAPNYNIKNFESQQSVQGAPLEYYQRMSLSPETEFILPKDIIQGAKKYPLSEWERLIKEHKPWMGVLPFAGAAALSQKKKGGLIEDNRGQWAHPGKNTRISSPNITMDGVPYPVLAKANTGEERMMYPNQDYYFPGAEYVDEYPMMQRGGTLPPIYTSNPNDPRIRKYNDSLNLYNQTLRILGSNTTPHGYSPTDSYNSIIEQNKAHEEYLRSLPLEERRRVERDQNAQIHYPNLVRSRTVRGIAPFTWRGLMGVRDLDPTSWNEAYPIYKKPVQPVIYKKEIPKFERIGTSRKPNLNLIGEELERTNVPLIPNRPYRVEYREPSGRQTSAYFADEASSREFWESTPGEKTGYYDRLPKKQEGGMNRKGMRCPGPVCGPGRMDGEPTAVGNLLRNIGYGVSDLFSNIFTGKGKRPRFKTKYTAHLVENAEPNFLFYNFTGGAPSPAKSSTPVYDDAIVFNSPSGLNTTSLETSNVENMTYGRAEYGGPLVEYYKGKMTGPNMFQDGGFNLIPSAITNPYIQKAISSITNFLMPSSSQSQELEQGKIPTKISNDLLLKQAFKESQFNPKAVSPKGYKGLTQIGQDIIADYIKKTGVKNIDPFNPKHAKDIQEYAMNSLYNADFINKPNQSDQVRIAKTLAAYNWGRGNFSNFLNEKKKKGMDIYKSLDWMKDLPTETSDYINKILLNKSSDFNQQFQKSITNPAFKPIVSLYKEHGGQSNEGYYNYNYGVPEFGFGGPTRMNKFGYLVDVKANGGETDDEKAFQKFFKTLPNNLRKDTPDYNIRGYWDALGRPESFDYSQPKEADGYHHAFSRHPKTGEMLKRPQHPTFKMAIEEDRKAGYFPIVTPDGKIKTVSGKDFAGGGEYHHGYYDEYGGDISIPQLPNMQKPLLQYYYNKIK